MFIKRSDVFAKRFIFIWYNGADHSTRRLPFKLYNGANQMSEEKQEDEDKNVYEFNEEEQNPSPFLIWNN